MNIKCMLDNKEYSNKPQGAEIGSITNRLVKSQVEISIEDLSRKLIKGCTFKPALLNGKKETDWIQQQLFSLDFDENTTIDTELNRCKELNILPVFSYTSFSHTTKHHKFRLVFCTDELITDYNTALRLQLTLMDIFNNCDIKCKNLSRLYFGGRELIYMNYDNRIDYKDILNKYFIQIEESNVKENKPIVSKSVCQENIPQYNNRIDNTHILYCGENPTTEKSIDNYYNIKAFRERNAEYLKGKINNPHIILNNNQEFYDYIFKEVNLGELLEYKYPKSIKCLFHDDSKPSASIFQNDEGYWIYHCFGCGVSYNLLNIVEKLGGFKSRPKAYKFIREIFNIEIAESEWQKEQKEILEFNLKVLDSIEFEENCPTVLKNIKRNIKYLRRMIHIAQDNVKSNKFVDNEDNVIFFASTKFICKQLNMSENSATEICKKNVLFMYHDLLNKLDDVDINEEMLKRSQAIGVNQEDKNKKYRHINYYSIPSYTTDLLESAEKQGQKWQENNYSMTGLSREMFFRAEGDVVANKLYPQYKQVYDKNEKQVVDRTTTTRSNEMTDKITAYLFQLLEEKKYCTEDEIIIRYMISDMTDKTKSKSIKTQIKKSITEILDTYNLKRLRCNKIIKEQYSVDAEGYPFIIVKNEEVV